MSPDSWVFCFPNYLYFSCQLYECGVLRRVGLCGQSRPKYMVQSLEKQLNKSSFRTSFRKFPQKNPQFFRRFFHIFSADFSAKFSDKFFRIFFHRVFRCGKIVTGMWTNHPRNVEKSPSKRGKILPRNVENMLLMAYIPKKTMYSEYRFRLVVGRPPQFIVLKSGLISNIASLSLLV